MSLNRFWWERKHAKFAMPHWLIHTWEQIPINGKGMDRRYVKVGRFACEVVVEFRSTQHITVIKDWNVVRSLTGPKACKRCKLLVGAMCRAFGDIVLELGVEGGFHISHALLDELFRDQPNYWFEVNL